MLKIVRREGKGRHNAGESFNNAILLHPFFANLFSIFF